MSLFSKIRFLYTIYKANRTDDSKLVYLRSLGARIGDRTRFIGRTTLSTEPYLVEIGEDCLISDNVYFHTHDGGVKVLNSSGFFGEQSMDKMARIKVGNNCFIGSGARIMGGGKDW